MSFTEIILVVLYAAIFSFLILRLKFFQRFHLSVKAIAVLFIFKVIVGILYGYLHLALYEGGDTYAYFWDSKIVFSTLKTNPWLYLRLVFGFSDPNPAADIVPYKDAMMYYTTPSSYLLVRFHSIVRLVSFGYYNVHVVFYNFFTLIGVLYFFRVFCEILPSKKNLLVIAVFLFPSIAFWSSGMHKDGVSLAALGLILYFSYKIFIQSEKKTMSEYLLCVTGLIAGVVFLLFIRNFLLFLLIPILTALIISTKYPRWKLLKFALILVIYFGIVSNLNYLLPTQGFLDRIVLMQNEFKAIADGSSQVSVPSIVPTVGSILAGIPMAIENCLLRPWLGEAQNGLQLISAIENIVLLLLLLVAVIFKRKKLSHSEQSLLLFSILFAFSIFVVIGIIVPVLGALVRYKMVAIEFLLISAIIVSRDVSFGKEDAKHL